MPVSLILGIILLTAAFGAVAYLASSNMEPTQKSAIIKTVYFYLVSLIALLMVVFSTADLINLGLRTWVFPKADKNPYSYVCDITSSPTNPQKMDTRACEDAQKREEEQQQVQKQRDAVRDISMIVVGIPLFLFHWITIRKDKKTERV